MASRNKLSQSIPPSIRERLIQISDRLDFQRIVDWLNAYADRSDSISNLNDEEFTVMAGYLIQNTSFQLARELEIILPEIEDAQLKAFLGRLRDELKHWSLRELRDAQAYGLVGLWGHQRRKLYEYLGIKVKSSKSLKGAEVTESSKPSQIDEQDDKPLN